MTYNPCDKTRITYSGNGSQTDFTFQFTYTDETDVVVWLYNDNKTEWIEQQNTYVFAGPTIIRFITAPPRATNPEGFNIVIGRRTNVSIIDSTFYPGSSIRAQDLNDNFEQLRAGIEDGRCELSSSIEELKYDYWGKKSVSKRDALLTDDPPNDTTYREDQEEGYWPTDGDTKSVPTTGAVSARLDPYVQGSLPANLPNDGQQPVGKTWINTDQYWDSYWEPAANAWVAYINTGPRGQDGSAGATGEKGDTGFAAVIGKIGPGAWEDIVPSDPVVGALYIAVAPITGFPGGGVPEDQDALGFNGEQWINYGLLGDLGPVGPPGPEGEQGPVGPAGGVNSVNGLQGDVEIGVEQLSDFAYYPASEEFTFLGPSVETNAELEGTAYQTTIVGNELFFVFPKSNTNAYEVLSDLSDGDACVLCMYSGGVYVELNTTVQGPPSNNGGGVPSWNLQFDGEIAESLLGDYPIKIKSAFIANGQSPITTGQALIYDQTTEKWRPEDVKLNISALPLLP